MSSKVDQRSSTVAGDQVARDKITNTINVEIAKELSPAKEAIRIFGTGTESDSDPHNTILLRKLRAGEFNKNGVDMAIRRKAEFLKLQIEYSKTQEGRSALKDIMENLLMIINMKYISYMKEGDVLKASLSDIVQEFTVLTEKYKGILNIDEAVIEGMLYVATSTCALQWRIEGFNDD